MANLLWPPYKFDSECKNKTDNDATFYLPENQNNLLVV